MTVRARHDSLFKFAFSRAEHAASAVRAILPARIRGLIDFDAFTLQPGSFVDVELKARHTDVLYRTRLRARDDLLVYVLFEHQSTPDHSMPLRMLGYMVRIWTAFMGENPGGTLPPILPIVLHHGPPPWSAPTRLREMFDDEVVMQFGDLLPTANFIIDDLSTVSDDEVRARAMTGLATVTISTLKHIHDSKQLLNALRQAGAALAEVWHAPDGARAIEALTRYIMTNNEVTEVAVGETLGTLLGDEAQEVVMTTAQRLYAEGHAEGREEGRDAERRLGAHTLITKRFGPLDEAAGERFEALNLDGLAAIYEAIFTAESVDDLLDAAEAEQVEDSPPG
jgi:predicted transposase/invertase (TIGR01784 family)